MKFVLGTLRKPKIDGIREGIAKCPYFVGENIELLPVEVSSGISHTPLSFEEVMQGAKNRAENLVAANHSADYFVGIEGGVTKISEKAYIFGCVYIMNTTGEVHFGFSPMTEVPVLVENRLFEEGKELGSVMAELSGQMDIRSENGSMGAWTDNMLTRKDEFVAAFQAAIAPFYNKFYRLKK